MEYLAGNIESSHNPSELDIWNRLTTMLNGVEGIMGYKIPSLGFDDIDTPSFILRSKIFGLVIIDIVSDKIISFDKENEYWEIEGGQFIYSRDLNLNQYSIELENALKKNNSVWDLRKRDWREPIDVTKVLIFTNNSESDILNLDHQASNNIIAKYFFDNEELISDLEQVFEPLVPSISDSLIESIDSILDGSDIFSKTKKVKVLDKPDNMKEFIKKSLDFTFKLDSIQRQIALQVPPGPQRIRGLAGTGKTVILCMKAVLAHKANPNSKILFVFNTQSMYNQVRSTITQYYYNEKKEMPNWNNLHIYHAWGGSSTPGVYYNTANLAGVKPLIFMNVKGHDNPLEAIYQDLLRNGKEKIIPQYDLVLIDEAQDFSPAFFETIFYLTKSINGEPSSKRIIWAYDEFQSLNDLKIAQPKDIFGLNKTGEPNMPDAILEGKYTGGIEKDFVLPNSYRNPRINLMVAHGLALGLYSQDAKIPMADRRDWEARGYSVNQPNKNYFVEDDVVVVERPEANSKNQLERILRDAGSKETTLVHFNKSDNINQELVGVVNKIEEIIKVQKVEPEEIIVINLDTKNSREQFEFIRGTLDILNIKCITPGYVEATDAFKEPGYVTLSTAYRAKGNEANIVFIINVQRVINDVTFRMRNAIFVSITRSRGWCYLSGHGKGIEQLENEVNQIISNYPRFTFVFPNEDSTKRKLTILQSGKNLEKVNQDLDNIFSDDDSRAMLLEMLARDPKLLDEVDKLKKK